ncbi:MAG: hypothetical protein LIQ26_05625 [Bacteroidota bacterium]|nr:hypothetical protein [Bacteroidota bacterium]
MKRILILLLLVLTASGAYGQHHEGRHRKDEHRKEQSHKPSKKKVEPRHRSDRHGSPARGSFSRNIRREVACDEEWQMLWNGCHVRLIMDWVYIYDDRDNRILSGDEIYLLPNGNYKVRKGDFWRVYDRKGDMTFISGDEIRYWHPGYYAVRSGGSWHVCDANGDRIFGVWGDSVELMGNGIFRCSRGGNYYYYDKDGNQRM